MLVTSLIHGDKIYTFCFQINRKTNIFSECKPFSVNLFSGTEDNVWLGPNLFCSDNICRTELFRRCPQVLSCITIP